MIVLGIDTSIRGQCVTLIAHADGTVVDRRTERTTALSRTLALHLRDLLKTGEEVAGVVVVTGPGSYTGVRAGMAAALGVAHSKGVSLFGITSFEAVAAGVPGDGRVAVLVEAGRGAAFAAEVVRTGMTMTVQPGPARVELDGWTPPPDVTVAVLGGFAVAGAVTVDQVAGLAAAIPVAMGRGPLDPAGLAATQVATPTFALVRPHV